MATASGHPLPRRSLLALGALVLLLSGCGDEPSAPPAKPGVAAAPAPIPAPTEPDVPGPVPAQRPEK